VKSQRQSILISTIILIVLTCITQLSKAIDFPQWYRAPFWAGEPRFEKKELFSCDLRFRGAQSKNGFNNNKCIVDALQIYGPEKINFLTKGANQEIINTIPNNILNTIWQKKSDHNSFGLISFKGTLSVIDIQLDAQYNFSKNFFGELYIPFRTVRIHNISLTDHSTYTNAPTRINYNAWQTFSGNLCNELRSYNTYIKPKTTVGFGDIALLLGFTSNYEKTSYIDFIDTTIKAGYLAPTGKKQQPQDIFSVPLGYNGHSGLIVSLQSSIGLYEWITLSSHAQYTWFTDRTQCLRMKTACEQNGLIKLSEGKALVHHGSLWGVGAACKADRLTEEISLILGFSHYQQRTNLIMPYDETQFDFSTVNNDSIHNGWEMTTIHACVEFDPSNEESPNQLRCTILVDAIINGKKVLKSNAFGCSVGIDYQW
jgi:hypothetical protein